MTGTGTQTQTTGVTTIALLVLRTGELKTNYTIIYILTLVLLNPDMPCFCKQVHVDPDQLASNEVDWICIVVIHYVNLFHNPECPGSSNLIG